MLYEIVGVSVLEWWSKFGPMVKHWYKSAEDAKSMPKVELLYNEMSRRYELDTGQKFGLKIKGVDDARSKLVGKIGSRSQ
jgi:hypothetical protein